MTVFSYPEFTKTSAHVNSLGVSVDRDPRSSVKRSGTSTALVRMKQQEVIWLALRLIAGPHDT